MNNEKEINPSTRIYQLTNEYIVAGQDLNYASISAIRQYLDEQHAKKSAEGIRSMEEFQLKYFPNLVGKECPYCGSKTKPSPYSEPKQAVCEHELCTCGHQKNQHKDIGEFDGWGLGECGMGMCSCRKFDCKDCFEKNSKPSDNTIDPAEQPCEHCGGTGITENSKDQEVECIHCDATGKQPKENEVNELLKLSNTIACIKHLDSETIASHLIAQGYSKKENAKELVALEYKAVKEWLWNHMEGVYTMDNAEDIAINICKHFGQPKQKVLSEDLIAKEIFKLTNALPTSTVWILAKQLNNALVKEE